jgi:hypothetical protein
MYDFESARQRGGEADDDRSDDVDELLNQYHTGAGYGQGPPLAAESYDDYPRERADLADPDSRELLVTLFSHSAVDDYEDAARELVSGRDAFVTNDWMDDLEAAAKVHNIDCERLFRKNDGNDVTADGVLSELLNCDDDLVRASNPLVVANLYADKGLSAAEIADLFDVQPTDVTEVLQECGLLGGYSTPEPSSESDYQHNSSSSGLNVHA